MLLSPVPSISLLQTVDYAHGGPRLHQSGSQGLTPWYGIVCPTDALPHISSCGLVQAELGGSRPHSDTPAQFSFHADPCNQSKRATPLRRSEWHHSWLVTLCASCLMPHAYMVTLDWLPDMILDLVQRTVGAAVHLSASLWSGHISGGPSLKQEVSRTYIL